MNELLNYEYINMPGGPPNGNYSPPRAEQPMRNPPQSMDDGRFLPPIQRGFSGKNLQA